LVNGFRRLVYRYQYLDKGQYFAFLTNIIHQEWTGLTVKKHKDFKSLKTQNLRDHMSEAELIFTALAELSTRQIAETDLAKGVNENAIAGKKGGNPDSYREPRTPELL
jgi:hypothetical protein